MGPIILRSIHGRISMAFNGQDCFPSVAHSQRTPHSRKVPSDMASRLCPGPSLEARAPQPLSTSEKSSRAAVDFFTPLSSGNSLQKKSLYANGGKGGCHSTCAIERILAVSDVCSGQGIFIQPTKHDPSAKSPSHQDGGKNGTNPTQDVLIHDSGAATGATANS